MSSGTSGRPTMKSPSETGGGTSKTLLNLCTESQMPMAMVSSTICSSVKCSLRRSMKASSTLLAWLRMKSSVSSRATFVRSGRSEFRKSSARSIISSSMPSCCAAAERAGIQ